MFCLANVGLFLQNKNSTTFLQAQSISFFGVAEILSDSFISGTGISNVFSAVTSVFFQFLYVGPNGLSLLQADIFLVTAVIVLSIHVFRDSCSFHRAMQHSPEGGMMFSVKDIN